MQPLVNGRCVVILRDYTRGAADPVKGEIIARPGEIAWRVGWLDECQWFHLVSFLIEDDFGLTRLHAAFV